MSDYDLIISDEREVKGKKHFLLGNEAIARGVVEAGVGVAATYPGTPSSEVGDVLSEIAKKAGFYFEDSANEIVALEVAAAAAISGVRAFVFMKHVGLNVASDALMSTSYLGTKAGLVIMTADDPSMFSSQNEQDNRYYAEMARLPLIEPSNPQESKDYLVFAFDLSEAIGGPVLFRTTTRVSHMRALVSFGAKRAILPKGEFKKDPANLVILPATAYRKKAELLKRTARLMEIAENNSTLNRVERRAGGSDVGVVTSSAAYNSVMDVAESYDLKLDVLKLGFSNPLPEKLVATFLKEHTRTIVVEELDPILEGKLRVLAQLQSIPVSIHGKMDGYLPYSYEYSPDIVANSLSKILGFTLKENTGVLQINQKLPARTPVLCPGCPHRATFYAMELVSKQLGLKNAIYSADIGCYSLGVQKPFYEGDYLLCMGSSTGTAAGFSKSTDQPIFAFIGDSTFFHAGIPGLVNAVHNGHKFVLVVMDNRTTAMTGNQSNPGVPINGMLGEAPEVSIEELIKAAGVKFVRTIDPTDLRNTMQTLKEALRFDGMSAIISRSECALLRDAEKRRDSQSIAFYEVNQARCSLCMNCIKNFSCPAFYLEGKQVRIDPALCDGCGVCSQPLVCGPRAIEVKR